MAGSGDINSHLGDPWSRSRVPPHPVSSESTAPYLHVSFKDLLGHQPAGGDGDGFHDADRSRQEVRRMVFWRGSVTENSLA